jgi:hypothetical protein
MIGRGAVKNTSKCRHKYIQQEISMKRVFLIGVIGLALCVTGVLAQHSGDQWGIGVQFGGGIDGFGADLTLKIPQVPVFWTVGATILPKYFGLGLAGDYYFIDNSLVPDINLDWYLGGGGYAHVGFGDDVSVAVGARLPIGLSWHPIDLIEVYIQAVPSIGLSIVPIGFDWGIGGSLGIRFWL